MSCFVLKCIFSESVNIYLKCVSLQIWMQKAKTLNDVNDDNTMKKRKLFNADGNNDEEKVNQENHKKIKIENSSDKRTVFSQSVNSKLARFAKSE